MVLLIFTLPLSRRIVEMNSPPCVFNASSVKPVSAKMYVHTALCHGFSELINWVNSLLFTLHFMWLCIAEWSENDTAPDRVRGLSLNFWQPHPLNDTLLQFLGDWVQYSSRLASAWTLFFTSHVLLKSWNIALRFILTCSQILFNFCFKLLPFFVCVSG